ncbi:MAG TPA: hypothetical protein VFR59_01920 [Steroidobacteraceae bacterium]|nr:hypothetical protein [Steroidobacteraceae bacterium]
MRQWAVCVVLALALSASAASQSKLAEFKIKVVPSPTGVQLECESGCAWTHLSWDCREGDPPCQAYIDQMGMANPD